MSQHNRDIPKICENVSIFCHILEMASINQVAQGQYVVSNTRCPALHDYEN